MSSFSGPATNTSVIYTPTWAFNEPWVLATSESVTPFTLYLNATRTFSNIPSAAPISIVFENTERVTIKFNASPALSASPEPSSTTPTITSGETTSLLSSTDFNAPSSATCSNFVSTSRTPSNASLSSPTITTTRPSHSDAHSNSPSSRDNSRLSLGQTVGIAIGCIFVGAALAFLAACVLARRKRKRSEIPSSERSGSKSSMSDKLIDRKSPPIIMEDIQRPPPYMRLESLLARPSSDDELIAMFTQLNNSIADYAQRCMSSNPRSSLLATETISTRVLDEVLGPESPMSAKKVSALLQHDHTRPASLRHIIAWSILQNARSAGAPETTLLPPEISECMSSMTGMQDDVNGRTLLLAKWRQIVRVLMEPTYGRGTTISRNDPRQINIGELASRLSQSVRAIAAKENDERDVHELSCLLGEGAIFGYHLFTQPSEWTFDWPLPRPACTLDLVLFPALLKISDDQGHILSAPELKVPATLSGDT